MTGHQERPGIDWAWVKTAIEQEVDIASDPLVGLTSLARGADQVFANVILDRGGSLVAVIPTDDYERYFQGHALKEYRALLRRCEIIMLHADVREGAFLKAGKYIADACDLLVAVWDSKPAEGKGGTADVVQYRCATGKPWVHINPVDRVVVRHL